MKEGREHNHRGISSRSIRRPIGTIMITSVVLVLGVFFLSGLPLDLLPSIVYPQVRVNVSNPRRGAGGDGGDRREAAGGGARDHGEPGPDRDGGAGGAGRRQPALRATAPTSTSRCRTPPRTWSARAAVCRRRPIRPRSASSTRRSSRSTRWRSPRRHATSSRCATGWTTGSGRSSSRSRASRRSTSPAGWCARSRWCSTRSGCGPTGSRSRR